MRFFIDNACQYQSESKLEKRSNGYELACIPQISQKYLGVISQKGKDANKI
tara:strand:- start:560 stop:712 length:153 start_codon:yes stop_codon:yes gene_type:complete